MYVICGKGGCKYLAKAITAIRDIKKNRCIKLFMVSHSIIKL